MEKMVDIAIIGAGPAGLSAAINAAARGKTVRVFSLGSNYLRRAEWVENYLGLAHISGPEMMERFLSHAKSLGIAPEPGRVANLLLVGEHFLLNFGEEIVQARTVILAVGVSKTRTLPGEQELLGRGVSYCATCDGMLFRGKRAIVSGESESAAAEADFLASVGVQVTFVSFPQYAKGLSQDIPFSEGRVTAILGEERVTGALCRNKAGDKELKAEAVFLLRNSVAPSALLRGLETENGYIKVNRNMETNLPGVFAAGDCTGKPLQVSKAAGEGLIAALQAAEYLDHLQKGE